MFITCKKAVLIREKDDRKFNIPVGYLGKVPDWVQKNWYFRKLCDDGTVTAILSEKTVNLPLDDSSKGLTPLEELKKTATEMGIELGNAKTKKEIQELIDAANGADGNQAG